MPCGGPRRRAVVLPGKGHQSLQDFFDSSKECFLLEDSEKAAKASASGQVLRGRQAPL